MNTPTTGFLYDKVSIPITLFISSKNRGCTKYTPKLYLERKLMIAINKREYLLHILFSSKMLLKMQKTNIDSNKTLIVKFPYEIIVALPDFILRYLVNKNVAIQLSIPMKHNPAVNSLRFLETKGGVFLLR